MSTLRTLSPLDRLLDSAQNALSTVAGSPRAERANPGETTPDVVLDEAEPVSYTHLDGYKRQISQRAGTRSAAASTATPTPACSCAPCARKRC